MALVGGFVVVSGFFILVKLFGIVDRSTKVLVIVKSAISIIRNADKDDYQKEIALQKYAKELFLLSFLITCLSALAISIPFSVIWLMEFTDLVSMEEVIDTTLSMEFIAFTIALSIILFLVSAKKQ